MCYLRGWPEHACPWNLRGSASNWNFASVDGPWRLVFHSLEKISSASVSVFKFWSLQPEGCRLITRTFTPIAHFIDYVFNLNSVAPNWSSIPLTWRLLEWYQEFHFTSLCYTRFFHHSLNFLVYGDRYDREENCFRALLDIQFVAAMGPPGGGRNHVTPRYLRHFNLLYIIDFDDSTLCTVFETILDWWVRSRRLSNDVSQSDLTGGSICHFLFSVERWPWRLHGSLIIRHLSVFMIVSC